jgi:hypothetical protein
LFFIEHFALLNIFAADEVSDTTKAAISIAAGKQKISKAKSPV